MNVPSWDLFIILFFVVAVGYGCILQRDKVITTLLSIYTGIVISQAVSEPIRLFFTGDKTLANQIWVRANASPFTIQAVIFGLVVVLVAAKSGLSGRGARGALSPVELAAYGFFNATLILTALSTFMPPEMRQQFQEMSKMAHFIIDYKLFWLLAPVILMVVTGGLRRTNSYNYD